MRDSSMLDITFETESVDYLPELLKSIDGLDVVFAPFVKERPAILNAVSKAFSLVNSRYEHDVFKCLGKEKCVQKRLGDLEKRYHKSLNYALSDDGPVTQYFCPDESNSGPVSSRSFERGLERYLQDFENGKFLMTRPSDIYLGQLDRKSVTISKAPNGRSRIQLKVKLGIPIRVLSDYYLGGQVFLLGKGFNGYRRIYGQSLHKYDFLWQNRNNYLHPEPNHFANYGFGVNSVDRRTTFAFHVPDLPFGNARNNSIEYRLNVWEFSGLFVDAYGGHAYHNNSQVYNWLIKVEANLNYDVYYNFTSVENTQRQSFVFDIDFIVSRKQDCFPADHEIQRIWKQKILQLVNPFNIFPPWMFSPKVQLIPRYLVNARRLEVDFYYPPSHMIKIESRKDIEEHDILFDDECPICFCRLRAADEMHEPFSDDDEPLHRYDDNESAFEDAVEHQSPSEPSILSYFTASEGPDVKQAYKFPKCRHVCDYECMLSSLGQQNQKDECPLCRTKQNFFKPDILI